MAVLKDVMDRLAAAKAAQVNAWTEAQGVIKVDYDELTAAVDGLSRGELDKELVNLTATEGAEPDDTFKQYLLDAVKNTETTLSAAETITSGLFKDTDIIYCKTKPCATTVNNAFNGCSWLYVVEPLDVSTVTSMIGFMKGCVKIRSLTFTDGSFGNAIDTTDAFNTCSSLESITIPDGAFAALTTAHRMFSGCKSLKSITLPEGAFVNLTAAYQLFYGCKLLTELTLPEGSMAKVTNAEGMLYGCSSLASVTFPEGSLAAAVQINSMFSGCSSLTSVTFPEGSLANSTNCSSLFYNCAKLESVSFPDGALANASNMVGAFYGCSSLTSLTLPDGSCSKVTNMNNMLCGTSKLTSFTFPEGGMASCLSVYAMISGSGVTTLGNLDLSGLALTKAQLVTAGISPTGQEDDYFVREMNFTYGTNKTLTSCPLSGTLYKSGVRLSYIPNLDGASLLSWVNALYDWATNSESKETDDTSHILYMSDDQQSTFLAYDGGEDAYLAAMDRGWEITA